MVSNVPPHHTGYGFILGREIIHNLSWYLHNQTSPAPPAECWRSKHYESTYDRLCAPWFNLELTLIYISYILLAFRLSILPRDSQKPSILFHSVARSLRRFGRTCCSILSSFPTYYTSVALPHPHHSADGNFIFITTISYLFYNTHYVCFVTIGYRW